MSEDGDRGGHEPFKGVLTSVDPRTVAVLVASFLLFLGLPAALFAFTGRGEIAVLLLVMFAVMVVATGYALREAARAQRDEDR